MGKTWILMVTCAIMLSGMEAFACTGLLVGKKASVDGSVMISYAADSHTLYGELYRWPAATWPKGAMLDIIEWDTHKPLGQIPQVEQTYSVVGNMNEHQVAITESTFGGRPELVDTTGIMDYGSLIYVTLQRSKTAREAIRIMTDLVKDYGYYSSGETFSIADKNEAWVMEMIGKGPGNKGAVWVAIRIPDDCISADASPGGVHGAHRTFRLWCHDGHHNAGHAALACSGDFFAQIVHGGCVVARPVVARDGVEVLCAHDVAGRIFAVFQLNQGQQSFMPHAAFRLYA